MTHTIWTINKGTKMTLSWLDYLETYEGQNVDGIRKILETEQKNIDVVVEQALTAYPHMTITEAKVIVESEFTVARKAPNGIDPTWVSENITKIYDKLESLTEGEIKIIINNDVSKGSSQSMPQVVVTDEPSGMDVEMEGQRRGRGRPKKVMPPADLTEDELVQKLSGMGYDVKKMTEAIIDVSDDEELIPAESSDEEEEHEDGIGLPKEDSMSLKWADIVALLDGEAKEGSAEAEMDGTSEEEYEDTDAGLEATTGSEDEEIEEAISPEEADKMKAVNVSDNKDAIKDFMNSLNLKTRSGVGTKGKDVMSGIKKLATESEDEELDEEMKTLNFKKPVSSIKVGVAGKIHVDRNQATFSGGTVEVPEDINEE